VLCKHIDEFGIAYLDDIVVNLNSPEEHRAHVKLVFPKLQETGLYMKFSKWEF
jgi:hypothetical protein